MFYWIGRDLGQALPGQILRSDMQRLADVAYLQLTGRQMAAD